MSAIDDLAVQLSNDTGYSIGQSLFKGNLPPTPDNAIAIVNSTGQQPSKYIPEFSPMFKVLIRNTNYASGQTMMNRVRTSLQRKTNAQIGGTYFWYILAVAEGGWINRDEVGRDMWSINFTCLTR